MNGGVRAALRACAVGLIGVLLLAAGCGGATPGLTRLSNEPISPAKLKKFNINKDFLSSTQCAFCHPVEFRQWRTSMHAYAQHSPVFLAFEKFVMRSTGGTIGSFCVRCHTPFGTAMGQSPIMPNDKRHELALESVTCMVCHGQHTRDGQSTGVFHIPVPGGPIPTVYGPYYGHDQKGAPPGMRLMKAPHKSRYWGFITTSRFCGQCHDVILPDGTRIEEAYSEWKNSIYAREGITCQDCHMSPVPGKDVPFTRGPIVDTDLFPNAPIRRRGSNLFTGPDYSLLPDFGKSALGLDKVQFKKHEEELQKETLELMRNAGTMRVTNPKSVHPGDDLHVAVAVTNSGAGHNFPTGFAAERQLWVEIRVTDSADRQIFVSGDLDPNGDLRDYSSDDVMAGLVSPDRNLHNWEANFVLQNFRGTQSVGVSPANRFLGPAPFLIPATTPVSLTGFGPAARVFKRGIPPLATRTARYSIRIPKDAKGPLKLFVRLRFRNLPPHLLEALGIGQYRSKLQIVNIYTYKARIALGN